jgi:hypothetical protein
MLQATRGPLMTAASFGRLLYFHLETQAETREDQCHNMVSRNSHHPLVDVDKRFSSFKIQEVQFCRNVFNFLDKNLQVNYT